MFRFAPAPVSVASLPGHPAARRNGEKAADPELVPMATVPVIDESGLPHTQSHPADMLRVRAPTTGQQNGSSISLKSWLVSINPAGTHPTNRFPPRKRT